MTDMVISEFGNCNLPSLFLMKIKYYVSEYQLNKAADPIMTRKVYAIPTSLWKGIVILIHNAFLNITNDTMVKFIDSKQSFEIIFIIITPSLFFPMLLTKKKWNVKPINNLKKNHDLWNYSCYQFLLKST